MSTLVRFMRSQSGATAIEYSIVASLIAIVIVTAAGAIGGKLAGTFNNIKNKLS